MSKDQILKELRSLPKEELREVLDEANQWEEARDDIDTTMTPEFRAELERRIADFEANPGDEVTIDEALAEIDRHLKNL